MHKVSKTARVYSPRRATRMKPFWIECNRGELSINEHMKKRLSEDMYSMGAPKSGKTCSQCKFHSLFPDFKVRIKECRLPDGTLVCEQTGNLHHDSASEVHSVLPQRHKDGISRLFLINNKLKPTFVIARIKKHTMTLI